MVLAFHLRASRQAARKGYTCSDWTHAKGPAVLRRRRTMHRVSNATDRALVTMGILHLEKTLGTGTVWTRMPAK